MNLSFAEFALTQVKVTYTRVILEVKLYVDKNLLEIMLTCIMPIITAADDIFVFVFFRESKAWTFHVNQR